MTTLEGGCHCGTIAVRLETPSSMDAMAPRMCGCGFCRKHPAKWFADPAGRLVLSSSQDPIRYRFGTKTADFILCPRCGVIVAAICPIEGADFGIVNLNCFARDDGWGEPDALSDFDGEGTGDRLSRRKRNWMPIEQIDG